jgi:hypothetical protein
VATNRITINMDAIILDDAFIDLPDKKAGTTKLKLF